MKVIGAFQLEAELRLNKWNSTIINLYALKGRSMSKTDVQMIYELRKIGANINQLAKHINTLPSDENILYSLDLINQYLSDVETINRKLL